MGFGQEESHRSEPDSRRDSPNMVYPAVAPPTFMNPSNPIVVNNQSLVPHAVTSKNQAAAAAGHSGHTAAATTSTGRSAFENSTFGPFSPAYTAQRKGVGALSAEKRNQLLQELH